MFDMCVKDIQLESIVKFVSSTIFTEVPEIAELRYCLPKVSSTGDIAYCKYATEDTPYEIFITREYMPFLDNIMKNSIEEMYNYTFINQRVAIVNSNEAQYVLALLHEFGRMYLHSKLCDNYTDSDLKTRNEQLTSVLELSAITVADLHYGVATRKAMFEEMYADVFAMTYFDNIWRKLINGGVIEVESILHGGLQINTIAGLIDALNEHLDLDESHEDLPLDAWKTLRIPEILKDDGSIINVATLEFIRANSPDEEYGKKLFIFLYKMAGLNSRFINCQAIDKVLKEFNWSFGKYDWFDEYRRRQAMISFLTIRENMDESMLEEWINY